MARKTAADLGLEDEETVQVNIRLPFSVAQALRLRAVQERRSMGQVVERALRRSDGRTEA